jgi:hypothetical protein
MEKEPIRQKNATQTQGEKKNCSTQEENEPNGK